METSKSNPPILPTSFASEAWAAWQEKLDSLPPHITPEQKAQATEVLIRLMKIRAERQKGQ